MTLDRFCQSRKCLGLKHGPEPSLTCVTTSVTSSMGSSHWSSQKVSWNLAWLSCGDPRSRAHSGWPCGCFLLHSVPAGAARASENRGTGGWREPISSSADFRARPSVCCHSLLCSHLLPFSFTRVPSTSDSKTLSSQSPSATPSPT